MGELCFICGKPRIGNSPAARCVCVRRCSDCGTELTPQNCTAIAGHCDDCLADQAAQWNNSYDNQHNGPY